MSYTVNDDLLSVMPERSLIQLSSDDPLAGIPDWDVVAHARAYADGQIDARLRQRYTLPLASIPQELADWALALARYWLYQRRPDGADLPEAVKQAAKDSLSALDAVRDGKMSLGIDAPAGTPVEGTRLHITAPTRLFTADSLSAY